MNLEDQKVLDHGYVRYIDHMGNDEAIVEAARMSTGRGFVSWEPYWRCQNCDAVATCKLIACCENSNCKEVSRGDLGLLEFMYKNRHSTPFEFGELHIEVQAPIMVFREWHRHRTQAYSEFSARYSQMPNMHYVPAAERIQSQCTTNRQGSGEMWGPAAAKMLREVIKDQQENIYVHYNAWVHGGLAKETARINTPVSRYSKMRAKTDLRNWLGFLHLRMSPNAQWEIRQFANAVASIIKQIWPHTYKLFEEHDLNGVHLSQTERQRVINLLQDYAPKFIDDKALMAKLGVV